MLHLTLVGGDVACSSHAMGSAGSMGGMSMAASTTAHVATHRSGASMGKELAARPATDCALPVSAPCCDAMSSCTVATTLSVIERSVAPTAAASEIPSLASTVLESVLTTPEPPPPKA